jgi:hypothetical protein
VEEEMGNLERLRKEEEESRRCEAQGIDEDASLSLSFIAIYPS